MSLQIMNSQLYDTSPSPLEAPEDRFQEVKKTDSKLRDMALSYLQQFTPRRPDKALTLHELSTRLSIPTTWLSALLPHDPLVRRDGHGRLWREALQDQSNGDPARVTSSPVATIPDAHHVLAA
jgi:hypothetical protein